MFELLPLSLVSFLYRLAQDIASVWRQRKRRLSAAEKLELRNKWKPEFEHWIAERRRRQLRSDVIVRHVRRMDEYPEIVDTRGIASWFRVGLLDTYHRGILLGMQWAELVRDKQSGEWRLANHAAEEKPEIRCMLVGYVPFEAIESVDWEGDEYYGFPHIYCHFDGPKRQPYEKLAFCELRYLDDHEYWTEIAEMKPVLRLTRKRRIKSF
jgi:hypothetical protein